MIAADSSNQLDRQRGWEAESKGDESRFLGKCVDGGHAGIGCRRGVLGIQNSLRHLNKQKACVATVPPKGLSAQAPSAAAEVCCSAWRRHCLPRIAWP